MGNLISKRCGTYSLKYGTKRYHYGFKRRPQISAAFWRKNLISFGTFPYALCNLTFTNKLLVKGPGAGRPFLESPDN